MSLGSAMAFLERMKTDYDFKKLVNETSTAEERKAIVENEGFYFTKEEIGSVTSQLSDEEMIAVAGDWMCWIGCLTTVKEFAYECLSYGVDINKKKDEI